MNIKYLIHTVYSVTVGNGSCTIIISVMLMHWVVLVISSTVHISGVICASGWQSRGRA